MRSSSPSARRLSPGTSCRRKASSTRALRMSIPAQLDSWIAVNADGSVTAFTGKCELGQGMLTAQTQLVAEELCVPVTRVHLTMCDTDVCPDQGTTSGSQSTPDKLQRAQPRPGRCHRARGTAAHGGDASWRLGFDALTVDDGVSGGACGSSEARHLRRSRRPAGSSPFRWTNAHDANAGLVDRPRPADAADRHAGPRDRTCRVRPQRSRARACCTAWWCGRRQSGRR